MDLGKPKVPKEEICSINIEVGFTFFCDDRV